MTAGASEPILASGHDGIKSSMGILVIRRATLADLPSIDRLADATLAEHGLPQDSAVAKLDSAYFRSGGKIARGQAQFWVAVANGDVVGSAAVVPNTDLSCTFKTFYVAPVSRGMQIGSSLYMAAEEFARRARYRRIELFVSRRFRLAIDFYDRNGYILLEQRDNIWEDNLYRKILKSTHAS